MITLGIDIGGTSIKGGFVDEKGGISNRFVLPIDHHKSQEGIIGELVSVTKEALRKVALPIKGIGVGCPGSIDSLRGSCDYSNNLGWENLPLASLLSKGTGLPVKIANDANAAALGEVIFGVGKGYQNLVFLTIGTGIGSGLYLNGHLYEGNEGKGAELGHTLLREGGARCTCGRKGCFEAYCSVGAFVALTKRTMRSNPDSLMWKSISGDLEKVTSHTAFDCAKRGDQAAQKVLDKYIYFLGEGILNIINAFRPEIIVLGGGLSGQKEALTIPLVAYLEKNEYGFGGKHSPVVRIATSEFGNDAGILGAASLVF